jgi:hypothetical protein
MARIASGLDGAPAPVHLARSSRPAGPATGVEGGQTNRADEGDQLRPEGGPGRSQTTQRAPIPVEFATACELDLLLAEKFREPLLC